MNELQVLNLFKIFNYKNNLGKNDKKKCVNNYSTISFSINNDNHFIIIMKTISELDY